VSDGKIPFVDLATITEKVRPAIDQVWEQTLANTGFVGGAAVERFETAYAEYSHAERCVGVANGTDALELILSGLGIGPGDEVIVPANTFIATAEAVVTSGATPVFVDVDPETALITGDAVRAATTSATAAVMAVHLYGQTVDVDDLRLATEPAGLAVIEDSAQAHGAEWAGKRAGSLGVAAGFSFYPAKNLGAFGDGGAVTTNDHELADKIQVLANHGRSAASRYEHDVVGRNSRLDGLQAGILSAKLEGLDEANAARANAAEQYRQLLPAWAQPLAVADGASPVYHLFVIRCSPAAVDGGRDAVGRALDEAGIGWGLHYPIPCHLQPGYTTGDPKPLPVSEELAQSILSLPMHPHLSTDDIERVCAVLHDLDAG
jgi:dTDP-4-amino-4,6-dideoxygalactose transaminase